ncbi:DNA primase [Neptuniibacter sp. QD37_11]|uniref:DNA primase n=1 Tax=Neptuniibacter sp. QD37_11 TaxID=3398209 RepID=UPI0039F5C96A
MSKVFQQIPDDVLDDLRRRVRLTDVIGQFVQLKNADKKNASACCPFHREKTPSFTVENEKGMYYCFGCGAGGNVFSFLMEHQSLKFREAVKWVADHVNYDLTPHLKKEAISQTDHIQIALSKVAGLYRVCLTEPAEKNKKLSEPALRYLKDKRGFSDEAIDNFQLGYAYQRGNVVASSRKISDLEASKSGFLKQMGLVDNDGRKSWDRMSARIMFPIRNERGDIVAFAGRDITDTARNKYLNTNETQYFNKSKILYGLYEVKKAHGNKIIDSLEVLEGQLDVVRLYPYGVCLMGSSLTHENLELLFAHTKQAVFVFDGDNAGRKGLRTLFKQVIGQPKYLLKDVRIRLLPEDEDPDSYIKQYGESAYFELKTHSFIEAMYLSGIAQAKKKELSTHDKWVVISDVCNLIAKVDNSGRRYALCHELAEVSEQPIQEILSLVSAAAVELMDDIKQSELVPQFFWALICKPQILADIDLMHRLYQRLPESKVSKIILRVIMRAEKENLPLSRGLLLEELFTSSPETIAQLSGRIRQQKPIPVEVLLEKMQ